METMGALCGKRTVSSHRYCVGRAWSKSLPWRLRERPENATLNTCWSSERPETTGDCDAALCWPGASTSDCSESQHSITNTCTARRSVDECRPLATPCPRGRNVTSAVTSCGHRVHGGRRREPGRSGGQFKSPPHRPTPTAESLAQSGGGCATGNAEKHGTGSKMGRR